MGVCSLFERGVYTGRQSGDVIVRLSWAIQADVSQKKKMRKRLQAVQTKMNWSNYRLLRQWILIRQWRSLRQRENLFKENPSELLISH